MDKINIIMILLMIASIAAIFIFYKLSAWKVYGRPILPLKTRILISVLFPILIPIIFVLGFIFIMFIIGLIAIGLLIFFFGKRKGKSQSIIIKNF